MSKRKTEKRREGLSKKEGNLLRNNAVTSTVQGVIACQKATLPAVCIKTTIKGGKEGAWAGHMEWILRGKRSCDADFSEWSRPQLTHSLTNSEGHGFGSGTLTPLLSALSFVGM